MDNLGRLLLEKFESISDAPALNDTGRTLLYRVLAGEALKVASALNRLGISEDEPVLVLRPVHFCRIPRCSRFKGRPAR
jgi:non-ribosomal peptide synthetase component E (peptide arylation enzyme)